MEDPKTKREVNKGYLKFIKQQPCIISESKGEPHHTDSRGSGGSDYRAVMLSRILHAECHAIGKDTFQKKYSVSFDKEIIRSLILYIKQLKNE